MRIRSWSALFQEIAFIFWNTSYARDGHYMDIWPGPQERQYISSRHNPFRRSSLWAGAVSFFQDLQVGHSSVRLFCRHAVASFFSVRLMRCRDRIFASISSIFTCVCPRTSSQSVSDPTRVTRVAASPKVDGWVRLRCQSQA